MLAVFFYACLNDGEEIRCGMNSVVDGCDYCESNQSVVYSSGRDVLWRGTGTP